MGSVKREPVMKLEAERLWGGAGEYAISFEKAGWLEECRRTGGTFLLYTQPDWADFERVTSERDALQLMLNDLEEQNHSLEQRRYAEQQAREAAERRVVELEGLLAVRDDLLQSISCLGVFGLLHEDLKNRIKACVRESQSAQLRAALNPAAEAVSHDQ